MTHSGVGRDQGAAKFDCITPAVSPRRCHRYYPGMFPRRVSILGLGLLGGSLARAVGQSNPHIEIAAWDPNGAAMQEAVEHSVVHRTATSPGSAAQSADLIVLCAPIGAFEELFTSIAPHVSPVAIVTDVGSTKRSVVRLAERLMPGAKFVGSHPMAGGERQGLSASRADLFTDGLCLITPTEATDAAALETVEAFWQSLQMRTQRLSPDEHDALVARASHLPHAVAAALVNAQTSESLSIAAKGFGAVTRPAAGSPALWQGIFLDNRDHLREAILNLRGEMDELLSLLDSGDAQSIQSWLSRASKRRNSM